MVGFVLKLLGGKAGGLILGLSLGAVAVALLTLSLLWHGETGRADRVTRERDAWVSATASWQRAAAGWKASFRASERVRSREQKTARGAADESAKACLARVETARRSARAIQSIVTREVPHDPQGCPVRGVIGPADGLSDALQAPAARTH